MQTKISFSSDYMEGAHHSIIQKLIETNMLQTPGYGTDDFCSAAKEKIKVACDCPEAEVFFLVGGTQTNATVIDGMLQSYQGIVAAETGHISCHEAGAIEFGGHKVITIPQTLGKINANDVEHCISSYWKDENHEHTVMPGMVYISQPTEYGTLYSLKELTAISNVCRAHNVPLYLDGARLAYALASPENDVTLKDLAKLCDVFYIGGTKCGTLFGEAVVFSTPNLAPHFFTIIKQHGALFAKGRLLGLQFDALFTDSLYENIGKAAIQYAIEIQNTLKECGYKLLFDSPSNQIFVILDHDTKAKIEEKVEMGFWENYDDNHTVMRFATSWATTRENVDFVKELLKSLN